MSDSCGRLLFVTDGNYDGFFTITDIWIIANQLFHLPSNLIILLNEQFPQLVAFFEINCITGTGWGAAIFSAFIWFVVFGLVAESIK